MHTIDCNRRESEVPDHVLLLDCYQRDGKRAGGSQPLDYQVLGVVAVFRTNKSTRCDIGDGRMIALLLLSYDHSATHSGCRLSSVKVCSSLARDWVESDIQIGI